MKKIRNENAFLITCVSCICLLLLMCYFGISSVTRGTYAALSASDIEAACFNMGLTNISGKQICCPAGYTSSKSYENDNGKVICIKNFVKDDGNAIGPKVGTSGVYWTINRYNYTPLTGEDCDPEKVGTNGQTYVACRYLETDINFATEGKKVTEEYTAVFWDKEGKKKLDELSCYPVAGKEDEGCKIKLPDPGASNNYSFNSWSDAANFCSTVGKEAGKEVTIYANTNYYGCWNRYFIAYDYNGGQKGSDAPIVTSPTLSIKISNPTKTVTVTVDANGTGATIGNNTSKAQKFAGWVIGANNSNIAKYSTDNSTWTDWNGKTKTTAIYFKNLGLMESEVKLVANWTAVDVDLPTVTKTGHNCGWSTISTGKAIEYNSGGKYTPAANGGASVKMYAVCIKNAEDPKPEEPGKILTFNGTFKNGSTVFANESCKTVAGGTSCTMPIPSEKPTKSGYTFTGWGTSDGCASGVTSSFKVTGDETRYACFKANAVEEPGEVKTFKVTFKNGDALIAEKSCKTAAGGNSCTVPIPDEIPNKGGYTFTGWGTSDGCASGVTSSFNVTGDETRYACFKVNEVEKPKEEPKKENVTTNPGTGQIAIFIIWVIGLATVIYSVWYFKRMKEN